MKKVFTSFVLVIFLLPLCFSQDVITKKTGEDIQAKILEVGQTDIKYKKFDNLDGPSFTITKSDVLMVRYSNGTKDIFGEDKTTASETKTSPDDMCEQGKDDSKVNYKGKNSGAGWTCATSIILSPLIGLIPALACSSSEPNDQNLNYKDSKLMKNNKYNQCYTDQAHKTKRKKIWKNFAIGSGIWLVIVILGSSGG